MIFQHQTHSQSFSNPILSFVNSFSICMYREETFWFLGQASFNFTLVTNIFWNTFGWLLKLEEERNQNRKTTLTFTFLWNSGSPSYFPSNTWPARYQRDIWSNINPVFPYSPMSSFNLIGILSPWPGSICNGALQEKAERETVWC